MPPKFPPPSPERFERLQQHHLLSEPGQQAILHDFATGEIGSETTIYRLLEEAKALHPAREAERNSQAAERAVLAREQREMVENRSATAPTFVEYGLDGQPLEESPGSGGAAEPEPEPNEPAAEVTEPIAAVAAEESEDHPDEIPDDEDFEPAQEPHEYENDENI